MTHYYNYHYHSLHHSSPLGVIKNHFFQFDNARKVEERLHPKVQKPLAGFKHVPKQYQVLNDIAPDFNNQKVTNTGSDSILPEKSASNPHRTTNMHFMKKRNDELFYSGFAIIAIAGILIYIQR